MVLLDVRSRQEYQEGHLNGAINIPLYDINKDVSNILEDKNEKIVVYCQSGGRSIKAKQKLQELGYTNVTDIAGGLDALNN